MQTNIAPNELIGSRIKDAAAKISKSTKQTDSKLAEQAGIDLTSYYRYRRGKIPKACTDVVQLGVSLGIAPNQLFLDQWSPNFSAIGVSLNEEDKKHILRAVAIIAELSSGLLGEDRPAALLAGALEGIKLRRKLSENIVPDGSTAKVDERGTVLIEPPPARPSNRLPKMVNEAPAAYGKVEDQELGEDKEQ